MVFRNYKDPLYKQFRKNVLCRDNHKCQWHGCGSSKQLNVHHIKTWAQYPALRFDINNGITLCKKHHHMIKGLEHIYEAVFFKIVANKNNDK